MFNEEMVKSNVEVIAKNLFGYSEAEAKRFANEHYKQIEKTMSVSMQEYIARQAAFLD